MIFFVRQTLISSPIPPGRNFYPYLSQIWPFSPRFSLDGCVGNER